MRQKMSSGQTGPSHRASLIRFRSAIGYGSPPADPGNPTGDPLDAQIRIGHVARWMTIEDAVKHVQFVEQCPADAALARLREALGRGVIPKQWDDACDSFDYPPYSADFWRDVPIILEKGGIVLIEARPLFHERGIPGRHEYPAALRWRRLLIDRKAINRRWPVTETIAVHGGSVVETRRPTPSIEAIKKAAEAIYANGKPNIVQAENLIRQQLPGASRKLVRAVLKAPQFALRRRRAGNQPA